MLALALFLDLSTLAHAVNPNDLPVYRQALKDHPRVANVRGHWFHRCSVESFVGRPHYDGAAFHEYVVASYAEANVVPALPPLPGFPGVREEVSLSGIMWQGDRASLELDFGGVSYCATYRWNGTRYQLESEVRLPHEIGG